MSYMDGDAPVYADDNRGSQYRRKRSMREYYRLSALTIVPLYSGTTDEYREWEVRINNTNYCIVREADEWTLLFQDYDGTWADSMVDVREFLEEHNLILE